MRGFFWGWTLAIAKDTNLYMEHHRGIIIAQEELSKTYSKLSESNRTVLTNAFETSIEFEKLRFTEILERHADLLESTGNSNISILLACRDIHDEYWKKPLHQRVSHHMLLESLSKELGPRLQPLPDGETPAFMRKGKSF